MRRGSHTYILIILGLIISDQLLKLLILKKFLGPTKLFFIENKAITLGFMPTINEGLAFSVDLPQIITIIMVPIIVALLAFWLYQKVKSGSLIYAILLSVIIGGSLSNWIDRVCRGGVVDFIGISILNINFAIFNLADLAITTGVIIILLVETKIIKIHENI